MTEIEEHPGSSSSSKCHKVYCGFCEKFVGQFPRHLQSNHINEHEVQNLVTFEKGSKERRILLTTIRNKAKHSYNSKNVDMMVSRKTFRKISKRMYVSCPVCKAYILRTNSPNHYRRCIPDWIPGDRTIGTIGHVTNVRLNAAANEIEENPASTSSKCHKVYCGFCENFVDQFARHLQSKHINEPEVQNLVTFQKGSIERRIVLSTIKNKAKHSYDALSSKSHKVYCGFCKKFVGQFARHLKTKHINEPEVQNLVTFKKGSKERRILLTTIRNKAKHSYNLQNNDMMVSRKTFRKISKRMYVSCPVCRAYILRRNAPKHYRKCIPDRIPGDRSIGRITDVRINAAANETLKDIVLFPIRDDAVSLIAKTDRLIVLMGNELTRIYSSAYFHKLIRSKLRLLGRFMHSVKSDHPELESMEEIYNCKHLDIVIDAVRKLGKYDHINKVFKAPTTALNLGTLLKKCGNILLKEYMLSGDQTSKMELKKFLVIVGRRLTTYINKNAVENLKTKLKRVKVDNIPIMEDIDKLSRFLKKEAAELKASLDSGFDFITWKSLGKVILTTIQLFNRRLPGELERLTLEDYQQKHKIQEDYEVYSKLSRTGMAAARQLLKGNPVLIKKEVVELIDTYIKYRNQAQIPGENTFLFAIPEYANKHKYLSAGQAIREFSGKCDAKYPQRLRATLLKKQITTQSTVLKIPAKECEHRGQMVGAHRNNWLPMEAGEITDQVVLVDSEISVLPNNTETTILTHINSVDEKPGSSTQIEPSPGLKEPVQSFNSIGNDCQQMSSNYKSPENSSSTNLSEIYNASRIGLKSPDSKCSSPNMLEVEDDLTQPPTKCHRVYCGFCKNLVIQFGRHIEVHHADEPEVQHLRTLAKGSKERRAALVTIRKKARHFYNLENDDMMVTRKTGKTINKIMYFSCPACKTCILKKNAIKHCQKCIPDWIPGDLSIGRVADVRINAAANETLKHIVLLPIRDDPVSLMVKSDRLIVLMGNDLTHKHTSPYFHQFIRSKLRLLGRFMHLVKSDHPEFESLEDIFNYRHVDIVLDAIRKVGKYDNVNKHFETPNTALSLSSLLKNCLKILIKESSDRRRKNQLKKCLLVVRRRLARHINKIAVEDISKKKRRKVDKIPLMEDIDNLTRFLKTEATALKASLDTGFDFIQWKSLGKVILVTMQLFSRRLPSELERLTIDDYQQKDKVQQDYEVCGKPLRRGKPGNPLLIKAEVVELIDTYIKYRNQANIPQENKFLFAMPAYANRYKHLSVGDAIREFSPKCGAKFPERLRAGLLKKQMSTQSILKTPAKEFAHLGEILGQHKPTALRGPVKTNSNQNCPETRSSSNSLESASPHISSDCESPESSSSVNPAESCNTPGSNSSSTSVHSKCSSPNVITHTKRRWTEGEKKAGDRIFQETIIIKKKYPSLKELDVILGNTPALRHRTTKQVMTFLSNKKKLKIR